MPIDLSKPYEALERLYIAIKNAKDERDMIVKSFQELEENARRDFQANKERLANEEASQNQTVRTNAVNQIDYLIAQISRFDSVIADLCAIDKSFARFKERYRANNLSITSETADGNYKLAVDSLLRDAFGIANVCAQSVHASILQDIGKLFSSKTKKKYQVIIDNREKAQKITLHAAEMLNSVANDMIQSFSTAKRTNLEQSSLTAAQTILDIREEQSRLLEANLTNLAAQLDKILSANDVTLIKKIYQSLSIHVANIPDNCNPYIFLGFLSINFSHFIGYDEFRNLLKWKYAGNEVDNKIGIPAVFDIVAGLNFFFKPPVNDNPYGKKAAEACHYIMYTLLQNQPPLRQKFILFDPEERGKKFDPFLEFVRDFPDVMSGQVFTTYEQMNEQLKNLSAYVDDVGQTKLVNYTDIFDYNKQVREKQESLRTLVIMDFPKYFDERMLDNLLNIIKNGKKYGVNTLIVYNPSSVQRHVSDSYTTFLKRIVNESRVLQQQFDDYFMSDNVSLCVYKIPNVESRRKFIESYRAKYDRVKNTGFLISKILREDGYWHGNTTDKLSIPIGINENGDIQFLEFGDSVASGVSHFALITGASGSGKSTLLHTIIMNAILTYSPEDLLIYLMDFKGTEFKIYAASQVPHIKLNAINSIQEFGQSIIGELCDEMDTRSAIFKKLSGDTGKDIRNISQYRKITGLKMPRILVVLDEFQELFNMDENRRVAQDCGVKMAKSIAQARAFGIHFVSATQTLSKIYSGNFSLQRSSLNEMHVRIGLRLTSDEADKLFGETHGRTAHGKFNDERGSAVYMADDTSGSPIAFKVAFCPPELQSDLLKKTREKFRSIQHAVRVFDRDATPSLTKSGVLSNYAPREIYNSVSINLGEPIALGASVKIDVNRRKRNNILIIGSNLTMLDNINNLLILNILKSAHLVSTVHEPVFYLDGSKYVGDNYSRMTQKIISSQNQGMRLIETPDSLITAINSLYEIYEKRRKNTEVEFNTVHFIIKNAQWVDVFLSVLAGNYVEETSSNPGFNDVSVYDDNSSDPFGFLNTNKSGNMMANTGAFSIPLSSVPIRTKLLTLIESGYLYGVNVAVSASDFIPIKEFMYDIFIPKFPNKIIFALNNNDAERIIPEAKTEKLPENIVIFTDGINRTLQFKPYKIDIY